jgi:hypothetical protein
VADGPRRFDDEYSFHAPLLPLEQLRQRPLLSLLVGHPQVEGRGDGALGALFGQRSQVRFTTSRGIASRPRSARSP